MDSSSAPMNSNNTPPIHLRFSIAITSNIYASEENSIKVFSTPSSAASSFTDSDVSSSFTSTYTLDRDYDTYDTCKEEVYDEEYYPSIYSTSNPIDIPTPRAQPTNDSTLFPLNKATFGED